MMHIKRNFHVCELVFVYESDDLSDVSSTCVILLINLRNHPAFFQMTIDINKHFISFYFAIIFL